MPELLAYLSLFLFGTVLGWISGLLASRPGGRWRIPTAVFTVVAGVMFTFVIRWPNTNPLALFGACFGSLVYISFLRLLRQSTTH